MGQGSGDSQSEKEWEEREGEGRLPPTGLFPKWLHQPWLDQAEARNQEVPPGPPGVWQGPMPLGHLPLFSQICYLIRNVHTAPWDVDPISVGH